MKSIIACAVVALFLCSCQQIQDLMKPKPKAEPAPAESSSSNSSSAPKYDPVVNNGVNVGILAGLKLLI